VPVKAQVLRCRGDVSYKHWRTTAQRSTKVDVHRQVL
jgi:hypothetical protein